MPMPPSEGRLRVLFFGTGVPLHGLDILIEAAAAEALANRNLEPPVEIVCDRLEVEDEPLVRDVLQRLRAEVPS